MKVKTMSDWWETGFFGLHYDLHANAQDMRLGAELTPEHLHEQLKKVNPDFVQCDCKGHPGYSSYPTKVGSPSPGIVRDALRIHRDVTSELGIPLSVHYSGIWDDRAVELHPDWAALDSQGAPINPRAPQVGAGIVCPRSPYLEELMIPQLIEIIDEYDVDGFWIDGDNWAVRDCYCPRCRGEFTRRTGSRRPPEKREEPEWAEWRAFQRDSFVEYVARYADAIHRCKPGCAVCSNWMYTMRQPGSVKAPIDYMSGDFTSSFGCERAEMEGRYIDAHNRPWNLMAWTFCSTAEGLPHQTKTATHLCQEAAEVMSCGGGVFLYDQPQRSGWLNTWHQDVFAEVANFCRLRQPFCQNTRSVPEAALLFSDSHVWRNNPMPFCMGDGYHGLEGALHILMENQIHTDVLDETRLLQRLHQYPLVVIPEQNPVSDAVLNALPAYVEKGGTVLLTGAHLADLCPELIGVVPLEPVRNEPWHLRTGKECASLAGPWRPVRAVQAEAYAPLMREQQIGKDETEYPAVTVRRLGKGKIAAVHGDFMRTYFHTHHPRIRNFMGEFLDKLGIPFKCRVTAPPSVEISLREKDKLLFVNLVNRSVNPTLTPRLHIVETVPATGNVTVRLQLPDMPADIRLEPGGRPIHWSYRGRQLEADIGSIGIHDILTIVRQFQNCLF